MFDTMTRSRQAARPAFAPLAMLRTWWAVSAQRHRLSQLDAHALKDIGVSPMDAQAEAQRPFWDAPGHWCK